MKWILALMVLAVIVLHQDCWLWKDSTLVFGVLPMGLAYHAGYSVLAAITLAVLVKFAWPTRLEQEVEASGVTYAGSEH